MVSCAATLQKINSYTETVITFFPLDCFNQSTDIMVDHWGEDAPVAVAWEHDSELAGSTAGRLLSDDAWRPGCPTLGRWHFGEDWSSQSRHVERLKRFFPGKAYFAGCDITIVA